ncbi:MAG: FeoB-associated Cys-rich membrane protein [Thiohalomonadaceae bacterium]
MGLADVLWLIGILAGTAWALRRAFRSGRGGCSGCSASGCASRKP